MKSKRQFRRFCGSELLFHYFFVHLQGVRPKRTKQKSNQVGRLLAKQMNNTPSESAKAVHIFVDNLAKAFPEMDIYMIDERFTSKIASQAIAQSGLKKKKRQDKGLIDSVAAVLILQDFMQMKK